MSGYDQLLTCRVEPVSDGESFMISFVYAWNTKTQRLTLWNALENAAQGISPPWLVLGDFNAFIKMEEKIGYEGIVVEPCHEMQNYLLKSGLEDLNISGSFRTWCNQ